MNINNYLQTGVSVNVTADAGTGKTWFIIAKILRMLLDDVSPEKITAITLIPVVAVILMMVSVMKLSKRENILEFNHSLDNIKDIENILK